MLAPGDEFEGFVVDGLLGHGGQASVYRAHRDGAPAVALKVVDPRRHDAAAVARLHREYDIARRLAHPHVIGMDAAGPTWLTMELVDGGTVMRLTSLPDKLVALRQIADALDHTHRHGVVHCDVKPGNILIATDFASRGAVLVDFGVAHCVAPGVDQRRPSYVEASLPYAPPELLRGEPPSAASDEYGLACTMVELLTGSPPFVANTAMRLVQRQLSAPPPRISPHRSWIPHAVDSILAKAMAKRPDQRYGSCAEFISLVAHALR